MLISITGISDKNSGFTYIEVLVVLLILSIGLFAVAPKIIPGYIDKEPAIVKEMNNILMEAFKIAKELRRPTDIGFISGSNNIKLREKTFKLPDELSVMNAFINDKPPDGINFSLKVYPVGICDYFELDLSDGKKLISIPLIGRVRLSEK